MSRYLKREEIEAIKMEPKVFIRIFLIMLVLFILAITCRFALAADVTLQWDANQPPPTGYKLYQRLDGQAYDYTAPVWQGPETTTTIDNLDPGIQYYFVVRAFVGENESGDSNEVDYIPDIAPPANLRIRVEIGVYIDVNGKPIITQSMLTE